MEGRSGVEAFSGQYEITENTSISDGVDGGLMLEDKEVGMDTPIKCLDPAGSVVASPLGLA